jgi:hypothetical protein
MSKITLKAIRQFAEEMNISLDEAVCILTKREEQAKRKSSAKEQSAVEKLFSSTSSPFDDFNNK